MPLTALLFAVSATPAAFSQGTPDGQTPAVENVCDGQTGAAYGLCTAYCEAMDCDDPAAHADATACERVREQFQKHTGGAELPCAQSPCPGGNCSG